MFSHNVYYKTIMAMIRVLCYHHPVNSHSLDPTGIHFHSLKWQAKIKMVLQKKKKKNPESWDFFSAQIPFSIGVISIYYYLSML